MAEYNPSKIIKDGNTYNFRDTTKIPLAGSNAISGSLIPATDNSIDIGSSTNNIKTLYTKGITIDAKTIDTDANNNMTFNGHVVDTIEEQGNGYIRYSNGLQICWGTSPHNGFPFPKPFVAAPAINLTHQTFYNRKILINIGAMDGSTCFYNSYDVDSQTYVDVLVLFIAMGYWK